MEGGEGRDAGEHLTVHRTSACDEESSGPNVSSAEVEKLCSRGREGRDNMKEAA